MTTYSIRVYQTYYYSINGNPPPFNEDVSIAHTIPHNDILSLDIADNQAGSDDPFEINGRMAKIRVIKTSEYDWLFHLPTRPLMTYLYNYVQLMDMDATPECKVFYSPLVQIINDDTNTPIYTGLIKRDSLKSNLFQDTLEFAICDTVYVWITLAKMVKWYWPTGRITLNESNQYCSIREFFTIPLTNLFDPMSATQVDVSNVMHAFVPRQPMPLFNCPSHPSTWSWDDILPTTDNASELYCRLARYSCVWRWTNADGEDRVSVSFVSLYRSRTATSGYYVWIACCYRMNFLVSNPMQPVSGGFFVGNTSWGNAYKIWHEYICGAWNFLPSFLLDNYSYVPVNAYYGPQYQYLQTGCVAPYSPLMLNNNNWGIPDGSLIVDTGENIQGIPFNNTASPSYTMFGDLFLSLDVLPPYLNISDGNATYSGIAKGLCAVYGLTMRSLPEGGITVMPHLLTTLDQAIEEQKSGIEYGAESLLYDGQNFAFGWDSNTGILVEEGDEVKAITRNPFVEIALEDIINIEADGIFYDLKAQGGSISSFQFSEFLATLYEARYKEFAARVTTTFRITVPRTYFDPPYIWEAFKPVKIGDKYYFANKWSEPTYDDTFTIEAIGNWE